MNESEALNLKATVEQLKTHDGDMVIFWLDKDFGTYLPRVQEHLGKLAAANNWAERNIFWVAIAKGQIEVEIIRTTTEKTKELEARIGQLEDQLATVQAHIDPTAK